MTCTNNTISVNDPNGLIIIGVWDTLNVRSQTFDISPWVENFPGGQLLVLHQRDGDALPYQAANVAISGGTATWTFDEADSGAVGYGSASLVWIVGDEFKARSSTFRTYTAPTIGMTGTTPPDPWESWYERILDATAAAQLAEQNAAESAAAAEGSASAATAAQVGAGVAQQAAESAQAAAEAAQSAAGSSATAAAESAAAAEGSASAATAAQVGAGVAQQAAESAQAAAEAAQSAAGSSATAAAESADDAADSALAAAESADDAADSALAAADSAADVRDALAAQLPTDTASGDPATFTDGADGIPVKSLSVTFSPVQEGSGTPSPENVRPITGRDEITITANGESVTVSLGGTIYGGTLNATTGDLTITHLVHDLASLTWDTRRTGSVNKTLSANLPNLYPTAAAVMAEQYAYISTVTGIGYFNSPDSVPVGIYTYASTPNNGILYINLPLSSSPAGLVAYPLATPQTITLTPTEVDTILGANSIGADAGAVTVTYRADIGLYIDKRLAEG